MIYDFDGNPIILDDDYIRPYFEDEMSDTVDKVRDLITEPSLVFPVVTDMHRFKNANQTFDQMIENVRRFSHNVKCDFILNLGDLTEGDTTDATTISRGQEITEAFARIGLPYYFAQGNHDNNPYDSEGHFSGTRLTMEQCYKAGFSATRGAVLNMSEDGTDYYVDFDALKIRLVVLNACNTKIRQNYAYGSSTAAWLSTALNTEYTVLLAEHLSSIATQVWSNAHGTSADNITNALQSFVNGGGKLVQLSGHSHVDMAFVFPWLSVMCGAQKFENFNPQNYPGLVEQVTGYIDQIVCPTRVVNTATEDLWTACVFKPNSGELDCVRFGAGADRYFHYEPIAPTTLTARLSGVTWSSSDTSVATVSNGVVTGVASGTSAILAKDADGNYEAWLIKVE